MRHKSRLIFTILLLVLMAFALTINGIAHIDATEKLQAENVFTVVMDGIRATENTPTNAPHLWNDLKPLGTFYPNFRNEWITLTVPAHAGMLTGVNERLPNEYDRLEYPEYPTVFEYYRKQLSIPMEKTWVVVQHRNLIKINRSNHKDYGEAYGANVDCPGLHSNETRKTDDYATYKMLSGIMDKHHPSLVLVNFGMIDTVAHQGNWTGYINAIRDADYLIYSLWLKIQADPVYRDKTVMLVTSDHGRHLGNKTIGVWKGQTVYSWMVHGDDCEGCRQIFLLALGPGVKANIEIGTTRQLIDIAPTIGALMGFSTPLAKGDVMSEMVTENNQQIAPIYLTEIILVLTTVLSGSLICATIFLRRRRSIMATKT